MPGSEDIRHPILIVGKQIIEMFLLLFMLGILTWLATSLVASPSYMSWVLQKELSINRSTVGHGLDLEAWTHTAERRVAGPAHKLVLRQRVLPEESGPSSGDSDAASRLHARFDNYMQQSFYPVQEYYFPLFAYRWAVLGGVLAIGICFIIGSYLQGEAKRRVLVGQGVLLKPHRFKLNKMFLTFCASMVFAYPAMPLPLPAILVLPLFAFSLYIATRWTSASMMEL